ncbi:hypothetical protein AB4Z22_46330, partial [Paenibacillus sp. TAF58]
MEFYENDELYVRKKKMIKINNKMKCLFKISFCILMSICFICFTIINPLRLDYKLLFMDGVSQNLIILSYVNDTISANEHDTKVT